MKPNYQSPSIIVAMAATISCNYPDPDTCPFHCWESFLAAGDIPEHQQFPGYFPTACDKPGGGSNIVPLPDPGYFGRYCHPGGEEYDVSGNSQKHFLLKEAILADMVDEMLTGEQQDAYEEWAQGLAISAYFSCAAHLTCDFDPFNCDVDSNVTGSQACTEASVESLCYTYVQLVLEERLALPEPEQYPECSIPNYYELTEEQCAIHTPEMNGTSSGCVEDGSAEADGLDETAPGSDPFGDIDTLVACTFSTVNSCTLDHDLILNVMGNFSVFQDEDVTLLLDTSSSSCGPGVRLQGLSNGETATELADELQFQNGDVIYEVNGIILSSTENAALVLDEIANSTSFTVKRKRLSGGLCLPKQYDIEVE